ncbi:MAG: hypothetical protein ACLFUX_01605 [Spirochaetaceae bacterium]
MRRMIGLVLILVLLPAGLSLVAQTTDEEEEQPQFVEDLAALLEEGSYSGEDVAALVTAAQGLDWEQAGDADPAVVALAMELSAREDNEMEPLEQAQLALELARTAVEMENAGYDDRVVARAALEGAREVTGQIRAWKQEGGGEQLGERIRNTVRDRVVETARARGEREGSARADEARSRSGDRADGGEDASPVDPLP